MNGPLFYDWRFGSLDRKAIVLDDIFPSVLEGIDWKGQAWRDD